MRPGWEATLTGAWLGLMLGILLSTEKRARLSLAIPLALDRHPKMTGFLHWSLIHLLVPFWWHMRHMPCFRFFGAATVPTQL